MTDRDPPLVWTISKRTDAGEVYLTGLDRQGQAVWRQWWNDGALRFATAREALDVLRLYAHSGQGADWYVTRITLRCLRTA